MPVRWLVPLPLLWALALPARAQDSARAELVFLNVGQGDAILIRSPEGKTALIDAGPRSIVPQLRALSVDTIDLAIATHPHADHIGGMEEVLRVFPVRNYMDNGVPHTTATYRRLMQRVERSGVTRLQATARIIALGSVTLSIRPPPVGSLAPDEQSVGVIVEFGGFRALLAGDSQRSELEHFMAFGVPDVAVLKAPDHGSDDGVTPKWLAATKPEAVVISCGTPNPFGDPQPHALELYSAVAIVYRTDRDGDVTIRAAQDGTYEVTTANAR